MKNRILSALVLVMDQPLPTLLQKMIWLKNWIQIDDEDDDIQ